MGARIAVIAALGGALAGCGGDGAAPRGPSTGEDRRAIQERVATYVKAYMRGQGAVACRQLTPGLRRALERQARTRGFTGCADLFATLGPAVLEHLGEQGGRRFLAALRVHVELAGDRATAGLAAARRGRMPKRVALVRNGGDWRISALGTRPL